MGPKGVLARLGKLFRGVYDIDRPLLEFDRVATCRYGDADQTACDIQIAVMVDTDLGNDITRVAIADQFVADLNGRYSHVG